MKDDVREVATGFECGVGIENFNDIKPGDIIEAFEIEEIRPASFRSKTPSASGPAAACTPGVVLQGPAAHASGRAFF